MAKRYLITGGAGFIGTHLCERLLELGHEVVAVDDLSLGRRENIEHLLTNNQPFTFREFSILQPPFKDTVLDEHFDCVFHLAANSDIGAGGKDRTVDLERTFLTTWTVLECMAQAGIDQLVFASTSAIYGDVEEPTDENYGPLLPVSFYGAAKLASEGYASAYAARHNIRTWTFRFPNVIGPNATHGVIYDFVNRLLDDDSVLQVLGDGYQEKPYLHVHDLVSAILFAWENVTPQPYEVFNVAPSSSTNVRRIAEIVLESMALSDRTTIRYGNDAVGWPGDVPKFSYDTSKMQALGWQCPNTSDEAVRKAAGEIVAQLRDK